MQSGLFIYHLFFIYYYFCQSLFIFLFVGLVQLLLSVRWKERENVHENREFIWYDIKLCNDTLIWFNCAFISFINRFFTHITLLCPWSLFVSYSVYLSCLFLSLFSDYFSSSMFYFFSDSVCLFSIFFLPLFSLFNHILFCFFSCFHVIVCVSRYAVWIYQCFIIIIIETPTLFLSFIKSTLVLSYLFIHKWLVWI